MLRWFKRQRFVDDAGSVERVGDMYVEDEVTYICIDSQTKDTYRLFEVTELEPTPWKKYAMWTALTVGSTVALWFLL